MVVAVAGTSALQLALAMAQSPQGADYLHRRGVTDLLITFAGHLLSPQGGALGCIPELDLPQGGCQPPTPTAHPHPSVQPASPLTTMPTSQLPASLPMHLLADTE